MLYLYVSGISFTYLKKLYVYRHESIDKLRLSGTNILTGTYFGAAIILSKNDVLELHSANETQLFWCQYFLSNSWTSLVMSTH